MMDRPCTVEPPATPQGQGLVQECFWAGGPVEVLGERSAQQCRGAQLLHHTSPSVSPIWVSICVLWDASKHKKHFPVICELLSKVNGTHGGVMGASDLSPAGQQCGLHLLLASWFGGGLWNLQTHSWSTRNTGDDPHLRWWGAVL